MRVLLRPRWLVGTIIAVVVVVVVVGLGFWQLRRLDEKRDRNAAIEERSSLPVQPVDVVVDVGTGFGVVEDLVYRRASATGGPGCSSPAPGRRTPRRCRGRMCASPSTCRTVAGLHRSYTLNRAKSSSRSAWYW